MFIMFIIAVLFTQYGTKPSNKPFQNG